ncbi:class I poly(R)-hydroxyalkanoic acid synthase [Altererythrobacter sp. CC-YST694]|uniref:PHA/PHB synthase family protein n=1 Tax=Altererythrobacter sp. CC-YST694 TaxID=2755038 RepID=UPI001D02D0F6|nr:class I poly(R)-hydroxyalkanoic acid synthase [Altererythrobacter sp. CC-YST694]MCB5425850.1 class I poly(R)-hydroxyalkanoic acid synthase [Altererythrobacter sp. CC-YST694]
MARRSKSDDDSARLFTDMLKAQGEAARAVMAQFLPGAAAALPGSDAIGKWAQDLGTAANEWQEMWLNFQQQQALPEHLPPVLSNPAEWWEALNAFYRQVPLADPEKQQEMWREGVELWEDVLGEYGIGPKAAKAQPDEGKHTPHLPLNDRRFADPKWREQPIFALIHQSYLMFSRQMMKLVDEAEGLEQHEREQLRFATRTMVDALCPANFPMINPVVLERTMEKHGENLVKGLNRLAADLEKGQLTHTDAAAFRLGENIAVTPGKVVHETRLYQLIQYSPTTTEVLETPLVIFPPWINRFYILDLNPKKSFVKWAVDQGLTTFMVSWKSADESLSDVTWDDYIRAQIDAIDHIRARLEVPCVHTIGYCVAGTTLAATLAILARRGEADKVKSATFFTAQVDFEKAGELKVFVDDAQLEMIRQASKNGFLDGRYMAATFNLLRGPELIWNYVVNNYLLAEDYPAFDLLYWNGDVTNLPSRWHIQYLQDLYRDNLLVLPDRLSADGTPIDLTRIETPAYIQAGREDHIAPAESVFRMTWFLKGPVRFVLAGSGHIAGVVNPPDAHKYQFWTNEGRFHDLDSFRENAKEHPGSWWPDWISWLEAQDKARVPARGKRKPGGRGDHVIEDAPGRYVTMR